MALVGCTCSALAALVLLHAQTAHAAAPVNDDRANATVISTLPFTDAVDTVDATTEPEDPDCFGSGHTVWYSYTAPSDMTFRAFADTFGSSYDTTLSINTSDGQLECNDDTDGLQSTALFEMVGGVTYDIMVGSFFGGDGGALQFNIEATPPLDIKVTLDPTGKVDTKTGKATLSGTVHCSYPTWVGIDGYLKEKVNHVILSGDFDGVYVYCRGETTWTSPAFTADNGLFKGGKASAELFAFASNEFEFNEDHVTKAVKLVGNSGGGSGSSGAEQCVSKPLPAPEAGTAVFCADGRSYNDAEADCVARGGHLLSIHNATMQNLAVAVAFGIEIFDDWWIGLNDRAAEGTFLWTDGSPVDFTQWGDQEPNDAGDNEDCANLSSEIGGYWNDLPCDEQHSYICRLP